jgi:predicted NAD/FAD-dependent oxidoreductase
MSVRRTTVADQEVVFPHGCTLFNRGGGTFAEAVDHWRELGLVKHYAGRMIRLSRDARDLMENQGFYTAVPGINAICKHLVQHDRITFHPQHHVEKVAEQTLRIRGIGEQTYRAIVVAVPAPQAADMLGDTAGPVADVAMRPTWSAMLAWTGGSDDVDFDAAIVDRSAIKWMYRASSGAVDAWVVHLSRDWSEQFLEAEPREVAAEASRHAAALLGKDEPPVHAAAHRWRYVAAESPLGEACHRVGPRLVACGDWCLGDSVSNAWTSGRSAAEHVLAVL